MELRVAHTAELDEGELRAARSLLDDVFAGELDDSDWEHALGGVHALAWVDGDVVGHASVIQRRLIHQGHALRAGYVEAVGVRAEVRRRGVGAALMDAVEDVIRNAYDLGALGATDAAVPFYVRRGWRRWRGPSWALTPDGVVRTADEDGAIYVLTLADGAELTLDRPLMADWREGGVW
ncbi:Aminoglycoside 2'-N-acetyltransferase [Baekduia alba]|uniref:GNAT family N-acetyltransferase n=1 Tax=Baekduia alba TaxID=2997333 RepID=UPI00234077F5|nr:GNAT family N-acetyltransferase [Baekduia alba]WCB91599.1 Aminoglycoside 2'-N-acetyltransferase [Baekduia alba]